MSRIVDRSRYGKNSQWVSWSHTIVAYIELKEAMNQQYWSSLMLHCRIEIKLMKLIRPNGQSVILQSMNSLLFVAITEDSCSVQMILPKKRKHHTMQIT